MSFTTPTGSISDVTGVPDPDTLPTTNQDPAAINAAIASPWNTLTGPPAPVAPTVPVTVSNLTVKAPNATFARYAALLFSAIITLGGAAQILPAHHTTQDLVQFGIILAGVIGTALSSVTTGPWPGIFKTGFASLAAIGTLLVPYLANGASFSSMTATNWMVFGVAAANALATEMGVDVRVNANANLEENLLK